MVKEGRKDKWMEGDGGSRRSHGREFKTRLAPCSLFLFAY